MAAFGISKSVLICLLVVTIGTNCILSVPVTRHRRAPQVNDTGLVGDVLTSGIATTMTTTSTTTSTTWATPAASNIAAAASETSVSFVLPTAASLVSSATIPPPPTPAVVIAVLEDDLKTPAAASEHVVSTVPSTGILELGETQVIDAIQKGLAKLRNSGDRLRKFVDKIEAGIQTGAISKTIENVRTKIESGKVDLNKLVAAYKQKSPLTFDELIKRISEDSHVLLDKLHGKVESLSSDAPDAGQTDKSDETTTTTDEHPHLLQHPEQQDAQTTATTTSSVQ